jgi:hypothetical protein
MPQSIARRALAASILAGFGIAMALVALEIGVRMLHLVPDRFWEPDPTLGTKLIPGASGWWTQEEHEFVVPVRINAAGRRDLDRPLRKATGTYRILLLGDSFVEAMHVPLEQTFPRRLEAALAREGAPPVEVMSMGVSGYGTASQYLWYRDVGRTYHPDLVLLAFYPGNDVRNNSPVLEPALRPLYDADGTLQRVKPAKIAGQGERGWLGSSAAYRYFRKLLLTRQPALAERLANAGLINRAALQRIPMSDGVPLDYWVYAAAPPPEWGDAWVRTEGLLTALRDRVVADGARLVIMIVTAREQIYPGDWQRLLESYPAMQQVGWDMNGPERHVLAWCARAGVTCVPLSPAFVARRDEERLHFVHDGHWTAAGHALAALTIANFLRGGVVPTAQYAEGS